MVNRTKQSEGCIGISEKRVESLPGARGFFSSCSFTRPLLELNKLAFERVLQEELSMKVVLKSSL